MRNCEPTPRRAERGGAGNPPLQVRAPHFYPTPVNSPAGRAALSPPPLLGPRLLRCRELDSALLVAQHLPAEDAALPVRRATGRSAERHLGRLAQRRNAHLKAVAA